MPNADLTSTAALRKKTVYEKAMQHLNAPGAGASQQGGVYASAMSAAKGGGKKKY